MSLSGSPSLNLTSIHDQPPLPELPLPLSTRPSSTASPPTRAPTPSPFPDLLRFRNTLETGTAGKLLFRCNVPGVPLIFGLRNALFLEPPSASQRQYVKTSEEARLHMTDLEHHALKKMVIKRLAGDEEATNSSDENDDLADQATGLLEKISIAKKQIDIKDKPQFKRKRAKGPNPLSCKKKKKHENQNIHLSKETKDGDNTVKRSRKRKRSRKQQKPTETES